MADTLRAMVGSLRLQCPDLPYFLAAQFIRDRHRRAMSGRNWSFLRAETQILTNVAKTAGTVTVVRGSVSVVGSGTAWASTDVGRQFCLNSRAPILTVTAVADPTHLTLDQVWPGSSGVAQTYTILDAYWTAPTDFKQFVVILDTLRSWRLGYWVSQNELSRLDPQRSTWQDPRVLVDLRRNAATNAPVFELWPYTTAERNYVVRYFKEAADLVEPTDIPLGPISGDILVKGALADVCRWPGTIERPNPLFARSGDLARLYEREFQDGVDGAEVEDENVMLTWLTDSTWASWPSAPIDAKWLQSHA